MTSPTPGGSAPDWPALVAVEHPRLVALAYRLLGGWEEAEDAAQETWLRAVTHPVPPAPRAWLARICVNCCRDVQRRRAVIRWEAWPAWGAEVWAAPDAGPETQVVDAAAARALAAAVRARLPLCSPAERHVLAQAAAGRPLPEIAAALGQTRSAVKTRLWRARQTLRTGARPATHPPPRP